MVWKLKFVSRGKSAAATRAPSEMESGQKPPTVMGDVVVSHLGAVESRLQGDRSPGSQGKRDDRTPEVQTDGGTTPSESVPAGDRDGRSRCASCCPPCGPPLGRLRVEKIEGGLLVAGVTVAANCQLVLPVFGFLFLLVGCVLTAASYRGRGADEGVEHYEARVQFTGTSRALGPLLLAAGALMTALGLALCALARYAARAHQRLGFRCPLHGDFFPLSPQATHRTIAALEKGGWGWRQWCPRSAAPQCPRSRGPRSPGPQCPAPLPFLVTSMSGLSAGGAPLSPTQTFGSIRSLSGPREVASFPLSRTPTPPPHKSSICDVESALNSPMPSGDQTDSFSFVTHPSQDFHAVECRLTTTEQINNMKNSENQMLNSSRRSDTASVSSARKTVSVILPAYGKG